VLRWSDADLTTLSFDIGAGLTRAVLAIVCHVAGVEDSRREQEAGPQRAAPKKRCCVLCHRDLAIGKVKHKTKCGAGKKCHPQCKAQKRELDERAASAERPAKQQRRTKSDPGQPLLIASTRLRIRAPKPSPPKPKPRPVKPSIDPLALLDAAHARRMALLEEEKNGTGLLTTNASTVVWQ
jgi:hypothetical protein